MSAAGAKCPYCDKLNEFDILQLANLNKYGWINCRNCGLFLKVIHEKPGLYYVRFEKYDSVVSFGDLYPNGPPEEEDIFLDFTECYHYSEPPIPEATCQELKKIMIGIQVNCELDPTKRFKVFKNPESEKWVVETLVPKIIPIYNQYPFQIEQIMKSLYLELLLEPHKIACEHCGFKIPRDRQNNCSICLNGKTPPPPPQQDKT